VSRGYFGFTHIGLPADDLECWRDQEQTMRRMGQADCEGDRLEQAADDCVSLQMWACGFAQDSQRPSAVVGPYSASGFL
jgi:hypothetical protein